MRKSERYQQHAEECRALARSTQNEVQRRQLLELAETWNSPALERERTDKTRAGSASGGST